MTDLKLKDWRNADKAGTRFPPSTQLCPKCNQPVLMDKLPPDYGGGMSGNRFSESWGSQKFVCVSCQISFRVSYREKTQYIDDGTFMGNPKIDRQVTVSDSVPLIERAGYLLTPYDVDQEKYKAVHGYYRVDSYA